MSLSDELHDDDTERRLDEALAESFPASDPPYFVGAGAKPREHPTTQEARRFWPLRRLHYIAIGAEEQIASNEPVGDNRGVGIVRKRTQLKGKLLGKTAWIKRDKTNGKFIAVKKSKKKFKGVRRENKPA